MSQIEHLGREQVHERELFVIQIDRIDDLPAELRLPSRYFACLLAWDATGVSVDTIRLAGQKLISQGAAYFCLWGSDCERVHDLIDEVEACRESANPEDESLIMTTWHDAQPLSDAIWFVLYCTCPDEKYIDDCGSMVAISIGSSEWSAEIRSALSSPRTFSDRVVASGKKTV